MNRKPPGRVRRWTAGTFKLVGGALMVAATAGALFGWLLATAPGGHRGDEVNLIGIAVALLIWFTAAWAFRFGFEFWRTGAKIHRGD